MNKNNLWKWFATGIIALILLGAFFYIKFFIQPEISLNQIEVQELNGRKLNLTNYMGKPLVVNYWATWCGACVEEFPSFKEVQQQLGGEINFLVISDESLEKINKFSISNPYSFTYLRSCKNFSEFGITVRPTTYFYNSNGTLVTQHTGELEPESLKELIEKIK